MKKILTLILLFTAVTCSFAQYNYTNSFMRKAIVSYSMDSKGFYQKSEDVMLEEVDRVQKVYCYNKKTQNLYVLTSNSNCVITLTKDYAKIIKKNKDIPQLKEEEIDQLVSDNNQLLQQKYDRLNDLRRQHINDSIAKAKADSIAKAKADSLEHERETARRNSYRKEHDWKWIPVNRHNLSCSLCDYSESSLDSVYCVYYRNDSLYILTSKEMVLDVNCTVEHVIPVSSSLKNDPGFKYHMDVFRDSLSQDQREFFTDVVGTNMYYASKGFDEVMNKAPYGFFEEWGWSSEYNNVSFHFRYQNTNKKTIKYINVFFVITNDVDDVRRTGNFKGTGPLAQFESASWEWDSSSYYVAGDASSMEITKVVLTYMDGTQKILSKKMLVFDTDD